MLGWTFIVILMIILAFHIFYWGIIIIYNGGICCYMFISALICILWVQLPRKRSKRYFWSSVKQPSKNSSCYPSLLKDNMYMASLGFCGWWISGTPVIPKSRYLSLLEDMEYLHVISTILLHTLIISRLLTVPKIIYIVSTLLFRE